MKIKLLMATLLFVNCFYVFSQEEIPEEFSVKFNFLEIYNPVSEKLTGESYNCEWVFYKKRTLEFELISFDYNIILTQKADAEYLTNKDTGETFARLFLQDEDGIPYLMDYHNEKDFEVLLYKNVKEDNTFEMSYHFYNKE